MLSSLCKWRYRFRQINSAQVSLVCGAWSGIRALGPLLLPYLSCPSLALSDHQGWASNLLKCKKMHTLEKADYVFKTVCPANGRAAENYRLILWALELVGCAAKYILINRRIKRSMQAIKSAVMHQVQCIVGKQVHPQCSLQNADMHQEHLSSLEITL